MAYRPLPTWYRGTRFASTLEADWAATFDWYDIYWEYEPEGVILPRDVKYRPDFYLPELHLWAEAKGPHDERIEKPHLLNGEIWHDDWEDRAEPFVFVLRPPGPGERAVWEPCNPSMLITLNKCPYCGEFFFCDRNGPWRCRRANCFQQLERWDVMHNFSGDAHFARAPRTDREA